MPSTLSPCQYIYRAGSVIESTCPCIVCYMMCVVFCCPLALQFISKVFFRFRFNQSPPPPTHKKKKKKKKYIYIYKLHWWYYLHTPRESVFPVCRVCSVCLLCPYDPNLYIFCSLFREYFFLRNKFLVFGFGNKGVRQL